MNLHAIWEYVHYVTRSTCNLTLDGLPAGTCAAVARGLVPAGHGVPLVVEGELFPFADNSFCKDACASNARHAPTFHDAVGLTRVVDVAGQASAMAGVDVHIAVQPQKVLHWLRGLPRYFHPQVLDDELTSLAAL